jgi:hypothetical protein
MEELVHIIDLLMVYLIYATYFIWIVAKVFVPVIFGAFLIQKGICRWKNRANTSKDLWTILLIVFGLWLVVPTCLGKRSIDDSGLKNVSMAR